MLRDCKLDNWQYDNWVEKGGLTRRYLLSDVLNMSTKRVFRDFQILSRFYQSNKQMYNTFNIKHLWDMFLELGVWSSAIPA